MIDQCFLGDEDFAEKLKVKGDEEAETPRAKKTLSAIVRSAARALEAEPAVLSGQTGLEDVAMRGLVGYVLIRRFGPIFSSTVFHTRSIRDSRKILAFE